jgi:hypothetical protein
MCWGQWPKNNDIQHKKINSRFTVLYSTVPFSRVLIGKTASQ